MSTFPPAALQPPEDDRLGVLSGTAPIVRDARLVSLDAEATERLAERWTRQPWPAESAFEQFHYLDSPERTANWVLLLDALNFCFWGEPGQPRWRITRGDSTLDGYHALATALSRAVADGRPLYDAAYLADLAAADLAAILRPAPGCPAIPLFDERLAHAREVGSVLLARYDGQFSRVVEEAGHDAVALTQALVRDFSSFADIAIWDGRLVPFLKRAQICVADLATAWLHTGGGALTGLDELTAFADYKLPQLLRREGILGYAPQLSAMVDAYTLIPAGSQEEIEIRAATIWAVEELRRALVRRGVAQSASAIDYRLWAESQTIPAESQPYHRTRTIYY